MKALCKEADTCLNASTCAHGQSHNSTPQCGCLNTCYDFRDGKGATSATIYCVLKSEIVLPPPPHAGCHEGKTNHTV